MFEHTVQERLFAYVAVFTVHTEFAPYCIKSYFAKTSEVFGFEGNSFFSRQPRYLTPLHYENIDMV